MQAIPRKRSFPNIYRQKLTEIRVTKRYLGVSDDLKLSINASEVLEKRYLQRGLQSEVIETPEDMFSLVAAHVSKAERKSVRDSQVFIETPTNNAISTFSAQLYRAGLEPGQLSACLVLPLEDARAAYLKC